ncbi:MAG: preprotein translocase subunit Sec61beta [Candidatus Aenigmatarchaeota archaeon]
MARAKDRVYMPMSTGGLLRYQEEEEMFTIKPEHVVFIGIGIIALEVLIKFFG